MKFNRTKLIRTIIFFSVISGTLLVDLLTKYLTEGRGASIHNAGIAFGLFANARVFFIIANLILTALAIVAWYFFVIKEHTKFFGAGFILVNIGFSLFISGAIGNLYDRIVLGYVRDFISIPFFPPIFNFADVCLTVGTIFLVTVFIMGSLKKKADNAA